MVKKNEDKLNVHLVCPHFDEKGDIGWKNMDTKKRKINMVKLWQH
ncbi:MAG: hypothetical protein H6Q70_4598 [Firmicutes bacterium]|nr:hypothetical protein [Bacillota bacterium]